MVNGGIFLCLLLFVGGGTACVPIYCLKCNTSMDQPECPRCTANTDGCDTVKKACRKDFQVWISSNTSDVEEGEDVTLECMQDIPDLNVTFEWKKDKGDQLKNKNKKLVLKKVFPASGGQYTCSVNSSCGVFTSPPHEVTVRSNSVLILVICGVSALVLIVIFGLIMKFKLKRDNAKHRERMKQRAQDRQTGGPTPFTPRDS